MANRAVRAFVRQGPKRQALWANVVTRISALAVTTKSVGTSIGLVTPDSITLIRSRGQGAVHFDSVNSGDTVQVGIGLGIYTDDAFGIGATAMPGPLTDADWDWVYYKTLMFGPAHVAAETPDSILWNFWFEIDSKAMRKMKANQVLAWIVEGVVISGGGNFDIGLSCRHLFKMA